MNRHTGRQTDQRSRKSIEKGIKIKIEYSNTFIEKKKEKWNKKK